MTDALAADAPDDDRARAAFLGSLIADAISLPVHWYYDRGALDRDYPELFEPADSLCYLPPRSPHPDSILWRSGYVAAGPQFDILGDQAQFWGRRGVHYHQQLPAGGNTLNFQLASELYGMLRRDRDYDPTRWLDHYVAFMRQPARHGDTYVEEYHRHFFTNLAAGRKPINCGVSDVHIGGLAHVPAIVAGLGPRHPDLRRIVRVHVSLTHKDDDVLAAADALVRMLVRLARPDQPAAGIVGVIGGKRHQARAQAAVQHVARGDGKAGQVIAARKGAAQLFKIALRERIDAASPARRPRPGQAVVKPRDRRGRG